jgi:hypothetical protein
MYRQIAMRMPMATGKLLRAASITVPANLLQLTERTLHYFFINADGLKNGNSSCPRNNEKLFPNETLI